MRNRIALVSILTAFFAFTSAHSAIQLYLDKSFTIPGANPITQLQFADWDRDGIPEVAALSADSDVVIYSITGDSLILSYHNDLIPANPVSILFADVTRDSIPDLVLQYLVNMIVESTETQYVMDVLDGSESFARIRRYLYYSAQFPTRSVSFLGSLDIEDDGQLEFLVSKHIARELYWYDETITADSYNLVTYYGLPDTLPMPGGMDSSHIARYGNSKFKIEYRVDHQHIWGLGPKVDNTHTYVRISLTGSQMGSTIYGGNSQPCHGDFSTSTHIARLVCAGDLWPGGGATEFLVARTGSSNCRGALSDANVGGWERILGRMNDTGTFETIWSDSSFEFIGGKIVTDPLFPYSSLGIFNSEIRRFSFQERKVVESIPVPTSITQVWDHPYSNSQLRLVTTDGRKVELWGFDEATSTGEPPDISLPKQFELSNPYPNPFNPTVSIELSIPTKGQVRVEVFNLQGQRVASLMDETVSAGRRFVNWDASRHSSGVYFFRATFDGQSKTVKAILLK